MKLLKHNGNKICLYNMMHQDSGITEIILGIVYAHMIFLDTSHDDSSGNDFYIYNF